MTSILNNCIIAHIDTSCPLKSPFPHPSALFAWGRQKQITRYQARLACPSFKISHFHFILLPFLKVLISGNAQISATPNNTKADSRTLTDWDRQRDRQKSHYLLPCFISEEGIGKVKWRESDFNEDGKWVSLYSLSKGFGYLRWFLQILQAAAQGLSQTPGLQDDLSLTNYNVKPEQL